MGNLITKLGNKDYFKSVKKTNDFHDIMVQNYDVKFPYKPYEF